MASNKVTFTLDAATIRRLRDTAERLAKLQSTVGREAIEDFHDRLGKLSERERTRLLTWAAGVLIYRTLASRFRYA
jgi:predicted transcriptional regulator